MRNGYWWIYLTRSSVYWSKWLVGDSLPIKSGTCGDITEVPVPENETLVVCLRGENIRNFQVDLPRKNKQKFIQSLPYVLEDKLLHAPEAYHFIPIEKAHGEGRMAVAVVTRNEFENVLSRIKEMNWQVRLVTADYMYIANPENNQWILDATMNPLLLRGNYPDLGSVLSGDVTAKLHPGLRLAMENAGTRPNHLVVRVANDNQSEMVAHWNSELKDLGVEMDIRVDSRSREDWLAGFPIPEKEYNFLTGPYRDSSSSQKPLSRLVPAGVMVILILALLLTQVLLDKNRIESEYNFLRSEQEATYRELFPQARNLVDPRYQMEQAILQVQSDSRNDESGPMDFLSRLETLSRYIDPATSNIRRIEYDSSRITLDVNVQNYELLEELQRRLDSEMNVLVESAELEEGRVQSRIHLEDKT